MESKKIYYARRASAERQAAASATDSRARHVHLDLALRFEQLAAAVGEVDCKFGADEGAGHLHSGAGLVQF